MSTKNKTLVITAIVLVVSLFTVVFLNLIGVSWGKTEIVKSCQPAEIDYKSFGPYCLSVFKERQVSGTKRYIWVSGQSGTGYGHKVDYPNKNVSEQDLRGAKITWTDSGVELEIGSNTIFIPKKAFIGGR